MVKDYIKNIDEIIIYLAICCYSEDKEHQAKVERMAYYLDEIKNYLKNLIKD